MERSCGDVDVREVADELREVALSVSIVAAGDGRPVAPEQGRVVQSEGDVGVREVAHELREVALTVSDVTARDGRPVAPEQGRVAQSEGDVGAREVVQELREVALIRCRRRRWPTRRSGAGPRGAILRRCGCK